MKLFIDCSYIDFSRQPTGIPRVVLQYIERGYQWSEQTGIEVVPVVISAAGLMPVRPAPGANPPKYVRDLGGPLGMPNGAAARSLEKSAFHLQAALLNAGADVSGTQCAAAINHAFGAMMNGADCPPVPISKGDVLFCPAYWHDVPPDLFWGLQRQGCNIVTLVHDVLPITYKRFYQSPWKEQFEDHLMQHLRHADAVYAVSGYTARSIAEIAERKGLLNRSIDVAHNGYAPLVGDALAAKITSGHFSPVIQKGLAYDIINTHQPYVMVGSVEPKKGHIPTIKSFEALWEAGFDRSLVVIGRKGWLEQSVVFTIEQSSFYGKKLFWFQDFDDVDLFYAYQHSRGLIFASYAEGFGIPMVEAMRCGLPVVAYDTPVNREVLGEHGLFFDGFAELAEHLLNLEDQDKYAAIRQSIDAYTWPSWSEVVPAFFNKLVRQFVRSSRAA